MGFINEMPEINHLESKLPFIDHNQERPIPVTSNELADMISTAVVAATSAQAKKGATPESVRQATHAALGVSQQVSGPEPLES